MYIDTAYSKQRGKIYCRHLLRESYREEGKIKHRTVANISRCSEAEIAAFKLALKHKDNLAQLVNIKDISIKQGMRIGAALCLKAVADRIGLAGVLGYHREGRLALWQVMARCLDQGSRLSAVRLAESHAIPDILKLDAFNEDHLYRNLAWLSEQQEVIEKRLFWRRYGNATPQLFLYDVTSSYLEGEQNELGGFGYNRDKKKGKMQLVIGLLTGPDGTPVAVRVFAGNTGDRQTVAEQVRILAETFGVKRVTLVGDRGMLKQTETELLNRQAFHYITAITKPQITKLLRQGVFQMELFAEKVCEVEYEGVRYIMRRNPERAKEIARHRESKLSRLEKLLAEKNRYLAEHSRAVVAVAKRDVAERARGMKIDGWVKVEEQGRSLVLVVDEGVKEQEGQLDGCYAIKTDLPEEVASADIVHQRYKDLAHVERAFRTFKSSHLEIRPAYVRTAESTRGHVFVVMLAYMLERELDRYWRHLEVTVVEGLDELGSLRGVEITMGQVTFEKMPDADGLSKQLLDAAHIRLPEVLPSRKVHVATRKKLVSERHLN